MTNLGASLDRLRALSQKVAQGDYDVFEEIAELAADDAAGELHGLAEAFGMMVVRIEAREFHLSGVIDELTEARRRLEDARQRLEKENGSLKAQVSELRIHVDREKKEQEVEAIVESDYFKDLQRRARTMRARHSGE
ncbi:hypothetical protein [Amorphus coralli]|uniref:hypothetical protein n=1 Tax=Amorphus coralli TaxID=340680 RepID=UPI00036CD37F|nr:hypothetical protein [Amorphus coralli]